MPTTIKKMSKLSILSTVFFNKTTSDYTQKINKNKVKIARARRAISQSLHPFIPERHQTKSFQTYCKLFDDLSERFTSLNSGEKHANSHSNFPIVNQRHVVNRRVRIYLNRRRVYRKPNGGIVRRYERATLTVN